MKCGNYCKLVFCFDRTNYAKHGSVLIKAPALIKSFAVIAMDIALIIASN